MRKSIDETIANMFTNSNYNQKYMFYACIVGKCKIEFNNTMKHNACISFKSNHYILTINHNRFSTHSLPRRMGILKHECLHIINKHISRFSSVKMSDNVNAACDCAINQLIDSDHLLHTAIDLEFLNYICGKQLKQLESAEYYYNELSKIDYQPEEPDSSHESWNDSNCDDEIIEVSTDKIIDESIKQTQKLNGDYPKGLQTNLIIRKGENVKWKNILRNIIHSTRSGKLKTIKRPNRRFSDRSDIKGVKRDRKFNILVVWDVSGSVSNKASMQVLNEIKSIHDTTTSLSTMTLIQVDTVAYKPTEFTHKTKFIQRQGNGGTMLYPAIIKAEKEDIKYDCLIILTDGYLDEDDVYKFANNKNKSPVIWLITKRGNLANNIISKNYSKRFSVVRL